MQHTALVGRTKILSLAILREARGFEDRGRMAIESVTENNGVVGVGSGTSRTGSTSGNGGVKAFATRKGKGYYNRTQYQDESQ